jgi:hypothetical protein
VHNKIFKIDNTMLETSNLLETMDNNFFS